MTASYYSSMKHIELVCMASVEKVGLEGQKDVAAQLASILKDLANDLKFIHSGKTESVIPDFIATNIELCIIALAKASQCYSEKQEAGKSREKHLQGLPCLEG